MFAVSTHYATTGTQTLFSRLLITVSIMFCSRPHQSLLEFINTHPRTSSGRHTVCLTVKPCGGHKFEEITFIEVYFVHFKFNA